MTTSHIGKFGFALQKGLVLLVLIVMGLERSWADVDVWDGTLPSKADVSKAECNKIGITGSGTEADPYVISTAKQFAYFASKMGNNSNWWKLQENVELDLDGVVDSDASGKTHDWTYGQSNANFKGHFDGNGSTISNMKLVTNGANKSLGLFPQMQGSSATNHAEIKNLTLKNCQITTPGSATSYGGTTNVGLLLGKMNGNADIENVTITGGSIAYDVTTTGANYVGALAGNVTSDNSTVKQCAVSGVSVTTGTGEKRDFYLGGLAGNVSNNSVISGNTVSGISFTLDGNTSGNNIIGGLIGKVAGTSSTASATLPMGKRSWVQQNTVENPIINMNGSVETAYLEIGGLIGWIGNHNNVFNNKVTSPTIALNNSINNTSYVGGAVGYFDKQSFVDGMIVNGGSITGPTSDRTVKNNVVFFVGGFVGYQNSSAATNFDANKFKNIAVTGVDINLGHYVPVSNAPIQNHKFSVGGIAGSVNAPNMRADGTWGGMPENLIFKGGKIYAPWASTSPIVGNFNAGAASHQNMTLDQVTTVDAIEKAKANTWYYNDYRLGLSADFLSSTSVTAENAAPAHLKFRKNYSKATETIDGIEYLAIDNNTLTRYNRYQDSERDLKTVLWWTQQASKDNTKTPPTVAAVTCFTANEQPIYPQSGAASTAAGNLVDYPYYMYFFQGVGNAKYASNSDAANIVKGIEANFTNNVMPAVAMADETNLNVTITNDGETRRGFDARTLTVVVKEGSEDVTSNYTYQWYVDGKADGTGTTKTLTPHWKDSKGITVNVLNGTTIVATTSYGFGPGMLHTKASAANPSAELIRSDYNNRGTSTNPYIIDCESALRQLSYLSTVHTNMFWETLGKPASPYPTNQSQGHYDRAYYKLSADINLGGREFTPISHVGYGGDGSWGTYSTNWIFQGVFDGQGHKISNFKITWGASQYVGNNVNLYYGLFGAIGGAAASQKWGDNAASNTTVKNLIIDGATLTHNTSETSFYYDQRISTNANNCTIGVLAGIVSSNTTIQNIEIRGSVITDAGSQDYSLAARGLYVGGAIGSMQHAYGTTSTAMTNTQVQHIAAQVDITLTHPTFVSSVQAQLNQFNIGGIIGRYMATSATKDQAQATMPAYIIYSGKVNAPNAWISPVIGATRFTGQNGNEFKHYSKQWEGNNNSAATQITITNALYYDYYIGSTKITDKVPSNTCGRGTRTLIAHADGTEATNTYNAQKYQGVNYGAQYLDIEGASLEHMNTDRYEGYNWIWEDHFVHMTTKKVVVVRIMRTPDTDNFTASLEGGTATAFRWQARFEGTEDWIDIPGVSTSEYNAPKSIKAKSIVANVYAGDEVYRTTVMDVEANPNLINPIVQKEADNVFTFDLQSTAPDGQMQTACKWYYTKADANDDSKSPEGTATSFTGDAAKLSKTAGAVWCKVTVTELGVIMYEDLLIAGATVIYVNGNEYTGTDEYGKAIGAGKDTNNGLTPQTPVKTIDVANSLLKSEVNGGTVDNNIIVIMGVLNDDYVFHSSGTNPATLTGKHGGHNYEGVIRIMQVFPSGGEHNVNAIDTNPTGGTNCYVLGDTKFEHLIFYGKQEGNSFIELHGHDAIFGKGLVMKNFKNLSLDHGNLNNSETIPEFTIILYATNLSETKIRKYTERIHDRGKPQTVTFQSGHYGRLMAGRFTQNFFHGNGDGSAYNTSYSILGSAERPVWAVVNVEIDKDNEITDDYNGKGTINYSRDVNAVIAGLTDGSMYGDYTINFYGGNVAYIVGANQGNPVKNGTATYTPKDGTSGSWGEWPNASYFGRTVINIDQKSGVKDITVGNLYAGGLGRKVQTGSASAAVDMYVYGRTEVNVKSGTVSGSVYGGGVGGVLGVNPWDAHVPYATTAADTPANAIINNVQYGDNQFGGTWSSMTKDSPMAKVKLHNLKDKGDGYVVNNLDLTHTSTTVNISGGTVKGNVYGGGYGSVLDMPVIAAVQGVGSVFGTSNINVTGGEIDGNIYGGSQGASDYFRQKNKYDQTIEHIAEMNGTVNIHITGTADQYPIIGGNIYGGGKGISSKGTEEYSRIATTGNRDLTGGHYTTAIHIVIDLPDDHPFEHNIYGGGQMGLVDGSTEVVIKGGLFKERAGTPVAIFGGGEGEDGHPNKAKVTGNTKVVMDNSWGGTPSQSKQQDVYGNIYGGGEKAIVDGNTKVHIRTGNVEGDVFGAGKGDESQPDAARVMGKTTVIVGEEP